MQYYIVDAFTSEHFKGNPAGICLLNEWLEDETMQNIAFENNLAETAFLMKEGDGYALRWFTPECEIDLCGHATLASAYILLNLVDRTRDKVIFHTRSGVLTVYKDQEKLRMNFPSRKPVAADIPNGLSKALGIPIVEAYRSRDLIVLVDREETVRNLAPDFELLKQYESFFGIVVTARGDSCDFVSRYFAPNAGLPEDPVTGSSHSTLIPFWSERLHKTEMFARQLSKRGGCLYCRDCGERVEISGEAKLYLSGEIELL
ncbi:PhzF family phenazine biosynthesis protein [Caproiciproducens sp.]|uniref:PhzF family phenazine biosynthesis protein n=1 Tax=Caproiciproducens sp. TaxID=1954376 RepID=UPI0028A23932|nr:PhzF family phenazine biosynthesis protein [Caproiciproducens sp.]